MGVGMWVSFAGVDAAVKVLPVHAQVIPKNAGELKRKSSLSLGSPGGTLITEP
jgi:hypothetical protein